MNNQIRRLLNLLGQLIKREGNLFVNVLYHTKTNQSAKYSVQRGFNFMKHDFVRVKSTMYASLHHLYAYFSLLLPTCPLINISMILSNSYVQNVWLRSTSIYVLLPNRRTRYHVSNYIPQMNYLSIRRTFHKILENMHG